jgi:hypothetical protein
MDSQSRSARRWRSRRFAAAISVVGILSVLSCKIDLTSDKKSDSTNSGGNNGGGGGSQGNFSIALAASRTNLTIQQGATDTVTITLTKNGGFTGPMTFQIGTGAIQGVSTALSLPTTAGNVTTQVLTVSVPGNFQAGTFPFFVSAESPTNAVMGGIVNFMLTVTRKPGVFVSVTPTISIAQTGSPSNTSVKLTRTLFTDPVTMSLSGAPPGMTATFTPNPIIDTTTTMQLRADATVPVGVYNIGVRANEGLATQATAPVAVTVTAAPSVSISLETNPLTVVRGSFNTTVVNIVRTNFTGSLGLSILGQPSGISIPTGVPLITGNIGQLQINAAGNVTPGTYQITVTAGAPNITTATAPLTLVIPP